jgi:HEAT repeat protein
MRARLLRIQTLVALVFVAILGLLAWSWFHHREPEYLGRPLSYWSEPWQHHGTETPERETAAFAAMDERAVRWLARQLDWRPSKTFEAFAGFVNKFGDLMPGRDYDGGRRESSVRALTRLGPRARSALPELEALSRTTVQLQNTSLRGQALGAIIKIRGEPVAPYIAQLRQPTNDWAELCFAIGAQGTNAAAAAPVLAEALSRTNREVWLVPTIAALGRIQSHPETSVPALVRCLEITNRIERQVTLDALGQFGPAAQPAWPALLNCLTNTDRYTSQHVARVMRKIDPAAAARLGF